MSSATPKPICERIGAKVMKLRKYHRMTLRQLADRVDSSASYIWEIEEGRSEPGAGMVLRLCRALSVSADELLGVNEE